MALASEDNGVGALAWSPDGNSIAFTSTGPDPKSKKERKDKYGDFDIIGGDYTMNHLWRIKVPAEMPYDIKALPKPEALTKGDQFTVSSFSWSPNGARIAFTGSTRSRPRIAKHATDLYSRPRRSARPQAARTRAARTAIRNGRRTEKKSPMSPRTARSFTSSRTVISPRSR